MLAADVVQSDDRRVRLPGNVVQEEARLLEPVEFVLRAFDRQVRQVVHDYAVRVFAENLGISVNLVEHVLIGDVRRVVHPHMPGLGDDRRLQPFVVPVFE